MAAILSPTAGTYLPAVNAAAAQYNIPSAILQSIAQQESSFNQNVPVGGAGEIGIMQLTPAIYQKYGVNPFDPTQNINGAAHYLSDLFTKYGNWTDAISHYNGTGSAAQAYATKVLNRANQLGYNSTADATGTDSTGTTSSIGDAVTSGSQLDPSNWLSSIIGGLDQMFPGSTVGTTPPPGYDPSKGGITNTSPAQGVVDFLKTNAITIGLVLGGGFLVFVSLGSLFNSDKIIEQVKSVAPLVAAL